jgi:hypothetical protein
MAPNPADPSTAENLGNLISPGDRVCYFIAVSKYNHNAAVTEEHNRTSQVVCVTVAKSPLVQITGGDVIVRWGNGKSTSILTSHAVINRGGERTYGSWIEYAAFAPGSITTHTAGVLKGGAIGGTVSPTDLTFANTGGGGKFGALAQAPSLMDNFANWSNIEGEGTWNISNANTLETGTYYQRTGTVRISQPLSNFNKSVVIEADTIEINGNITYANPSGGYTKLRDLPQLVLKADTIIVGQAVTNIDAWLLAGKISTCGAIPSTTYYSGLNTSTCNTTLTVNGPIQTESLYLRRTAGAEGNNSAALSTAAEKLNLRADAYLWLQGQSTKSAGGSTKNRTIRTEYIRELSPRY